MTDSHLTIIII